MIKKQSTGFVLKSFLAIVIAFILVLVVLLMISRPVAVTEGVVSHLHVDLLQDMLSAAMRGMNAREAQEYVDSLDDPVFLNAELTPLTGMTGEILSRRLGVPFFEFENESFLKYEAFVVDDRPPKDRAGQGRPRGSKGKRIDDFNRHGPFKYDSFLRWLGFDVRPENKSALPIEKRTAKEGGVLGGFGTPPSQDVVDVNSLGSRYGEQPNGRVPKGMPARQFGRRTHFLIIPLPTCDQILYIRFTQTDQPTIPANKLIMGAVFALLVMLVTALILILPTIIRIHRYELVCERVAHGDYHARCDEKRNDTLGVLAHHIDEMTNANLAHMEQQKNLLQAVGHEMRTPIARIRFSLELLDIPEDDVDRQARLASIDEDLTEIDSLIRELTYFNYVDAGNGRQHIEESDVRQMIETTVKKSVPTLSKFNVAIEGVDKDYVLMVDPVAFRRAIGNLLGNAQRYAKENIAVFVAEKDGFLEVAVEDDGPGIPIESRKDVLLPFASVDKARNKAHSGVGLGLAIVDRILKVHGGTLSIEDSSLGGCRMVTKWPITSCAKP